ncbi:hypothetical protein FGO68_gene13385 [Halteria grandinella]|uniref:Uncharacterized protein n=1 Tax=Halteria grandinella TaxID=5974 RepID=A0A8J8P1K5_HALGN|nr:hypothetical protein FGO68_gene13385 [Halteria grandinella]
MQSLQIRQQRMIRGQNSTDGFSAIINQDQHSNSLENGNKNEHFCVEQIEDPQQLHTNQVRSSLFYNSSIAGAPSLNRSSSSDPKNDHNNNHHSSTSALEQYNLHDFKQLEDQDKIQGDDSQSNSGSVKIRFRYVKSLQSSVWVPGHQRVRSAKGVDGGAHPFSEQDELVSSQQSGKDYGHEEIRIISRDVRKMFSPDESSEWDFNDAGVETENIWGQRRRLSKTQKINQNASHKHKIIELQFNNRSHSQDYSIDSESNNPKIEYTKQQLKKSQFFSILKNIELKHAFHSSKTPVSTQFSHETSAQHQQFSHRVKYAPMGTTLRQSLFVIHSVNESDVESSTDSLMNLGIVERRQRKLTSHNIRKKRIQQWHGNQSISGERPLSQIYGQAAHENSINQQLGSESKQQSEVRANYRKVSPSKCGGANGDCCQSIKHSGSSKKSMVQSPEEVEGLSQQMRMGEMMDLELQFATISQDKSCLNGIPQEQQISENLQYLLPNYNRWRQTSNKVNQQLQVNMVRHERRVFSTIDALEPIYSEQPSTDFQSKELCERKCLITKSDNGCQSSEKPHQPGLLKQYIKAQNNQSQITEEKEVAESQEIDFDESVIDEPSEIDLKILEKYSHVKSGGRKSII